MYLFYHRDKKQYNALTWAAYRSFLSTYSYEHGAKHMECLEMGHTNFRKEWHTYNYWWSIFINVLHFLFQISVTKRQYHVTIWKFKKGRGWEERNAFILKLSKAIEYTVYEGVCVCVCGYIYILYIYKSLLSFSQTTKVIPFASKKSMC